MGFSVVGWVEPIAAPDAGEKKLVVLSRGGEVGRGRVNRTTGLLETEGNSVVMAAVGVGVGPGRGTEIKCVVREKPQRHVSGQPIAVCWIDRAKEKAVPTGGPGEGRCVVIEDEPPGTPAACALEVRKAEEISGNCCVSRTTTPPKGVLPPVFGSVGLGNACLHLFNGSGLNSKNGKGSNSGLIRARAKCAPANREKNRSGEWSCLEWWFADQREAG